MEIPWQSLHHLTGWHVRSVERARNNAMVAATALAARRREHQDVEDFLAAYLARRNAASVRRTAG